MNLFPSRCSLALSLCFLSSAFSALAEETLSLLKTAETIAPGSDHVSFEQDRETGGLDVTIRPGDETYPGIRIAPGGDPWNLSAFGHVEAAVRNTGEMPLRINLRVDNAPASGQDPWNTESAEIQPGETVTFKTIFGHQYGFKKGFALNPSEVVAVLLFTHEVKDRPARFRVDSLAAGGPKGETPPIDPNDIRIPPQNGIIFGPGIEFDPAKQVEAPGGILYSLGRDGATLDLRFSKNKSPQTARIIPTVGRWDLRDACEIRARLRNAGTMPVTPAIQVTSDRHHGTDTVSAAGPVAPGAETEIVVPFEPAKPWRGPDEPVQRANASGKKGFGTTFDSDKADAVAVTIPLAGEEAAIEVMSIEARATPIELPGWLGQRPPVEGEWTLTFNDDFDGETIDPAKWNVQGPNYWGAKKLTHWSRDNVIVRDGIAAIRLEKKRGFHNDDPSQHQSDYTGGYLDTYDKWRQRYGYFEARMKLPTAPGLWPAFWVMPDRGRKPDPMWKRQDTGGGAMEFDIMEHLTRWGPYRYNIAMHWDGYGKGHKSLGTSQIYLQPDPEGFLTSGLLWTPGLAVFYCNGKEVGRYESDQVSRIPSIMMFTLPIGGWDNSPLDDSQLPGDFLIDYVRVWQRADLASEKL